MKKVEIDSVEQLLKELNSLPNNYIFRGHADAQWRLESALERVLGDKWSADSAMRFEDYSLSVFQSKFHLYDTENVQPDSKLAWLSIMQHYGVPTRLLDFTESPYVALYFALEDYDPHTQKDFATFAIDYTAVMQKSIDYIAVKDAEFRETRESVHKKQDSIFDEIVDRFLYDIAWIAEPRHLNARLDRQAGSFLVSGNRSRRIEEVLSSPIYGAAEMIKYRIRGDLSSGVFAALRKMNVTSKSLYGDLGGLARSIRMQMKFYAV